MRTYVRLHGTYALAYFSDYANKQDALAYAQDACAAAHDIPYG